MSGDEKESREVSSEEPEDQKKLEDTETSEGREKIESSSDGSESESESATSSSSAEDSAVDGEDVDSTDLPAESKDSDEQGEADEGDEDEPAMTFLQHMDELRRRFIRIFIACGVGFLACYSFAKPLFSLLMAPLVAVLPEHSTLIFTSLPEGFVTYLKVSFVAGIFLVSPYIFSQIWGFIAPGLYEHERKWMIPLAFLSACFFVGGALFGYYVVFPFGCEFFMGFADEFIRPMPTLREYLSFSLKLLFAFGVIFELPLFIFFLARLGLVTHTWLREKRKYAILVAFICSAILTPPDVITQTLMAIPLILLYEIGIWTSYFFGKKGGRLEANANAKAAGKDPKDSGPDDDGGNGGATASSSSDVEADKTVDGPENEKKQSKKDSDDKNPGYDEDMIEM
ncbi:twin-arginine translocase subunit TatC [Desulfovibrio gilichinskyi]|uniref:Sec-independent protein translocase protein TatC n=1 Tax=Desulfovibrio gilichinskyi TaxID=1519643 RepID=A0A1X7ERS9_9BACT|nr:twin-arginine translocase subunit TatC [Desulfovibrio gilichinskyi]SMF38828.1 sec-independent protein translocase protein TatC [Desulfovibrio gilichinskyi]